MGLAEVRDQFRGQHLVAQSHVRYRLKTLYPDGATRIALEPSDFIARLPARCRRRGYT